MAHADTDLSAAHVHVEATAPRARAALRRDGAPLPTNGERLDGGDSWSNPGPASRPSRLIDDFEAAEAGGGGNDAAAAATASEATASEAATTTKKRKSSSALLETLQGTDDEGTDDERHGVLLMGLVPGAAAQ